MEKYINLLNINGKIRLVGVSLEPLQKNKFAHTYLLKLVKNANDSLKYHGKCQIDHLKLAMMSKKIEKVFLA